MAKDFGVPGKSLPPDGRNATSIRLSLASPEMIRGWSWGEVKKPETINYRTFKPERDGLFCERIFGPVKSWECYCGKYKKLRHKDIVCDRCGVDVVDSRVRRERMGHIELEAPVAHVWFVRSVPSRMAVVLGMSGRDLEKVIYYEQFIVIKPGKTATHRRQLLSEYDFKKIQQEIHGKTIEAKMGAEAVYDLLAKIDLKQLSDMIRISMVLPVDIRDLELRVAYEEAYVVLEPGKAGTKAKLKKYEVVSESVYREFAEESGFKAVTGAEAVKALLKDALAREKTKDHKEISSQKMKELLRRLKVVEAFRDSDRADGNGNRPEWMILKVLPVQPPDLRPLVPLDGGRFATSDLNDLYRRVINRNSRLKKMIEIKAPEIIIRNEKRMLQESVDALFENGKGGHVYKGTGNRPLKSLSDMLKGKPGRFRQNLLGKRVDYSGRSVIVVGPELKLHECGLPKEMALELFKPFIMRKLEERDYVTTVKGAKKLVERSSPEVWGVLEDVIEEHPVLLNRAPTLHRLSVQAFLPVLVEGKAIQLHPLVCAAFNADFDGDQMAVHVPLSVEAQLEARLLMMATNNMLSPANGQPIVGPTQDMVMGIYYLTASPSDGIANIGPVRGGKADGPRFVYTPEEVEQRFDQKRIVLRGKGGDSGEGCVGVHDRLVVRYGNAKPALTTVGRTLFTLILPRRMRHVLPCDPKELASHVFWGPIVGRRSDLLGLGKREINKLIEHCYYHLGRTETILFLDRLKKLGFEYATRCGVTVGLDDVPNIDEEQISRIIAREQARDPKAAERIRSEIRSKNEILGEARRKEAEIIDSYRKNAITDRERYKNIVTIWTQATNDVTGAMRRIMERSNGGLNPIHMMAHSGARGREDQVRQLAGMRGLMAKPSQRVTGDEIIEFPIESNFKEGLSVFEYFVSTHGARKGLADTALKTADAGYLTRRLVDVAQDVKIVEDDCGTINGIKVRAIPQPGRDKPIEELEDRIQGRVAMDNIVVTVTEGDRVYEEFLVQAGQMISRETAKLIADNLDSVMIRSVLTCDSKGGVCAKCYGKDLATGREYTGNDIRRELDRVYRREIGVKNRDISTDEARDAICAEVAQDLEGKPGLFFTPEGFAAVHASFVAKHREAGEKSSVGEILVKMQREIDEHLGIDNGLVSIGEAVGVIAGQSIGEPGTQLTLRTFHVGGTADLNVARPFVRVPAEFGGGKAVMKVKYDSNLKAIKNAQYTMKVEQQKGRLRLYKASGGGQEEAVAFEAKGVRPDEVKAFHDRPLSISINRGKMILVDEGGKEDSVEVPNGAFIVEEGSTVRAGSVVAMWNPYTISIYAMRAGSAVLEDIEENRTMQVSSSGTERGSGVSSVETAVVSEAQDAAARAMHPRLVVEDPEGGHDVHHTIPAGAELRVGELYNVEGRQVRIRHHEKVKEGQVLASGQGKDVKSGIAGVANIVGPNRILVVPAVEVGDELARLPREEDRTGDITGGLPRVAELFDARRPKNCAVISEIDGRVLRYRRIIRVTVAKGEVREYLVPDDYEIEIDEKKEVNVTSGQVLASGPREPVKSDLDGVATIIDQETLRVRIRPPEGRVHLGLTGGKTPGDYAIPPGRHLEVRNGDTVRAGDPLTDGSIDPHDVLKIGGPKKVQDFLLSKIQEVYRLQGVTINDKHIEVIIRQMLRKVSITVAGDTNFLVGQLVDRERFMEENRRVHKDGKRSAEQAPILLGVTRAALTTEGWVSAASFQETTRVLAEAAVHGREDRLSGLKENVIMGHLISAGTGLFDEEEISMEVPKELEVPPTAANISSRMDDALEAIKAIGEGVEEEPPAAETAEKAPAEAPEKETE